MPRPTLLALIGILPALLLAGCRLPPSAAADDPLAPPLAAATPLATVVRRQHVVPLDPAAALLPQLARELAKTDPAGTLRGTTYDLTRGRLVAAGAAAGGAGAAGDWLIATPAAWGRTAATLAFVPPDCPGCDADFGLPSCRRDDDCPDGTLCRPLAAFAAARLVRGRAQRACLGHSDALLDRFFTLVAGARQAVDITTLQPGPDGRFLATLRSALTRLARSGRPVAVRVLVGQYPPDDTDARALAEALIRDARAVAGSRLTLAVAAERSCTGAPPCGALSWNHAKIVAVDGRDGLIGSHNMWTRDLLLADPDAELSLRIAGPVVEDAHRFADALWAFVCRTAGPAAGGADRAAAAAVSAFVWRPDGGGVTPGCLATLPRPAAGAAPPGALPMMAVARLGAGISPAFAGQSDLARDLMIGAAQRSVRLVQQDVGFRPLTVRPLGLDLPGEPDLIFPETTLAALADVMLRGGAVLMVLSNPGAAGPTGTYSNDVPLARVAAAMRDALRTRGRLSRDAATDLACRSFHLAPFRFGPSAAWPDGRPLGNHAKFWLVDERAFYVGSDNLYPVDLQEFGVIVEDARAAARIARDYWTPVWTWSAPAAVSGAGTACVLRAR